MEGQDGSKPRSPDDESDETLPDTLPLDMDMGMGDHGEDDDDVYYGKSDFWQ